MHLVSAAIVVLGYLTVGGFGYPKRSTLSLCQSSECRFGDNADYDCQNKVCDYVRSNSLCRGAGNTVFSQKRMQKAWDNGAFGKHGYYGNNCGYWSGCKDGKCKDNYDLKQCLAGECISGPFRGYGCTVVCRDGVCHLPDNYGEFYQPSGWTRSCASSGMCSDLGPEWWWILSTQRFLQTLLWHIEPWEWLIMHLCRLPFPDALSSVTQNLPRMKNHVKQAEFLSQFIPTATILSPTGYQILSRA